MPQRSSLLPISLAFLCVAAICAALFLSNIVSVPAKVSRPDYVLTLALPQSGDLEISAADGGPDDGRPLVVIDPGHGGHDPGAVGGDVLEKEVVLSLAKALRDRLQESGAVRVALTRDDDRFLVVEERAEIARRLGGDLFVSIHADSAEGAGEASGASIYTLSSDATNRAAARFAARENRADEINGVVIDGDNQTVETILVELSQRRAAEEASNFAELIERGGRGTLVFREPARLSANLAVLKAPDMPSILFEAGFVSNPDEAKRLTSAEGRDAFALVMARAIEEYFRADPGRNSGAPTAAARGPSIGSVLGGW